MSANAVSHRDDGFAIHGQTMVNVRHARTIEIERSGTPGTSDSLSPARGLVSGLLLGAGFWLAVAAIVVAAHGFL